MPTLFIKTVAKKQSFQKNVQCCDIGVQTRFIQHNHISTILAIS